MSDPATDRRGAGDSLTSFARWALGLLAASALVLAFWRQIAGPEVERPQYVENWQEALEFATPVDSAHGQLTLLVLADFECPACASYDAVIEQVREQLSERIKVYHVHYPLRQHRFAVLSAKAAECALEEGRFAEFATVLYSKQDSIGIKSWEAFASEAGIADSAKIASCATSPVPNAKVERARRFSERVAPRGTPTLLLEGWRFPFPPTFEEIVAFERRLALETGSN